MGRLEASYGAAQAHIDDPAGDALAEYFAVLGGGRIEERYDPELEAYFAELELQRIERDAALENQWKGY